MDENLGAVIATQDAVVLGRRSYDEWAGYWPGSDIEPFATFINGVAKYVATSTPLDREWAGSTVIDGGLVEFVRDLKSRAGGDIGVHASISVTQALLAAGVVDELRLVIAPTIAGAGAPALRRRALDPARVGPDLDLTHRLPARRLPRGRAGAGAEPLLRPTPWLACGPCASPGTSRVGRSSTPRRSSSARRQWSATGGGSPASASGTCAPSSGTPAGPC